MIPILGRINELSRKQRSSVGLTKAEKSEQQELRKQYLQAIRGQVLTTMLAVSVVDPLGHDVTPEKLTNEKLQRREQAGQ
ncbi:DUF896 domain-containing protein [Paenibacillus polymyxa]|uniref:UPF0291 protein BK131_02885 n=1 Tax=Paenibacillus amylolyticus TaxID=1451 RepID=A0A100VJ77_PAEAM|nr:MULTISPECIES: DUF896 domain-containing protein [Paenibacillus]APO44964.1 DUF896 family protein [Paenibacillus xylanexedens]KAA8756210.1 DUF896 domain-containing protein [Paenibacillus sp. UASWS1643]KLU53761.1 hypothetical protein EL84_16070 [Paenibacillus sp. VT-400]MDR6715967.1 uncharacterized protein YnzC (UPF0291/DUF896 family) [Paenibacillus sp. 2003]OMF16940.1 DUF896 family protein [Paenibacillus amylolyticus]